MLTVGLTGGYATGKSTIAAELGRLGCHIIHADELGRQALAQGTETYDAVVREFGPGMVAEGGEIDRKRLAALVFAEPAELDRLNAIVHPYVFREEQARIDALAESGESAIVVIEAAIMVEVGSWSRYDKLIVAHCPERVQIERAMERDGASEPEVHARLARQMPMDEKVKFADYVIDTSGSKEHTLARTREVWRELGAENSRRSSASAAK